MQKIPLFLCSLMLFIPFVIYYCILDFMVSKLFHEFVKEFPNNVDIRNLLLGITTWGGAPLLVWRTTVAAKQANTAQESLLNDKINEAMNQLNARLEETERFGKGDNTKVIKEWKDDISSRVAAIDRLEGLVHEHNNLAPRIVKSLATFIRANYQYEVPLKNPSQMLGLLARQDLQSALDSIGRILCIAYQEDQNEWRLNLRHCNFRNVNFTGSFFAADLSECIFDHCKFDEGEFKGVNFSYSTFYQPTLYLGDMRGANFYGTRYLSNANPGPNTKMTVFIIGGLIQGANFMRAKLTNIDDGFEFFTALKQAYIDSSTELSENLSARINGLAAPSPYWDINELSKLKLHEHQIFEALLNEHGLKTWPYNHRIAF